MNKMKGLQIGFWNKTEKRSLPFINFKNLSLQSKITPKFHKFAIHSIYEVMSKQTIKEILGGYKKIITPRYYSTRLVRAFRSNRFIALNDGSTINNLQIVVDFENFDENIIKNIKTASSLKITGEVIESEGKGQDIEIIAKNYDSW